MPGTDLGASPTVYPISIIFLCSKISSPYSNDLHLVKLLKAPFIRNPKLLIAKLPVPRFLDLLVPVKYLLAIRHPVSDQLCHLHDDIQAIIEICCEIPGIEIRDVSTFDFYRRRLQSFESFDASDLISCKYRSDALAKDDGVYNTRLDETTSEVVKYLLSLSHICNHLSTVAIHPYLIPDYPAHFQSHLLFRLTRCICHRC